MRTSLLCVTLLLAASSLAGCGSPETKAARERGIAEAEEDIAAGAPAILYIGRPSPDASPLDKATGLPRWSRGCEVSDESMAFNDAYNGRIREALDSGDLEGLTYRDKFTSRDAVRARFEAEGGHELRFGVEPVPAPGGRFAVELAPRSATSDTPYLFGIERETGARRELHFLGEPAARVLFDDEGNTLLLRDDKFLVYRTIDLRRGIVLQVFPDPDRGW